MEIFLFEKVKIFWEIKMCTQIFQWINHIKIINYRKIIITKWKYSYLKSKRVLKNKNFHSNISNLFNKLTFSVICSRLRRSCEPPFPPIPLIPPRPTILCRSNTINRRNFPWINWRRKCLKYIMLSFIYFIYFHSSQK